MDDFVGSAKSHASNWAATSTSAHACGTALCTQIQNVLKALENLEPEPFAAYMRSKGCDPDDGWRLNLPAAVAAQTPGPFALPRYVFASPHVDPGLYYLPMLKP